MIDSDIKRYEEVRKLTTGQVKAIQLDVYIKIFFFACLFSIHNIISLSCHEQVCLSGHVYHDMINLLYNWMYIRL